jgi:hypothetical protein
MNNFRQPISVHARKARAVRLLNGGARSLENIEDLLMRARVDLVELKRTGLREGLSELVADVTRLKGEIERLEEPREVMDS